MLAIQLHHRTLNRNNSGCVNLDATRSALDRDFLCRIQGDLWRRDLDFSARADRMLGSHLNYLRHTDANHSQPTNRYFLRATNINHFIGANRVRPR